ncbi:MAG: hypothetical protein KUG76_03555 [Gammaproteobacteria bacterium]|nr:hypothetical protein [Gammaproteobacteria bacterium]
MLRVDLLHNSNGFDTRDIQILRSRMLAVFREAELPPHWHEWSTNDTALPYYLRGVDPFSIFINGKLVTVDNEDELLGSDEICAVHHCLPSESVLLALLKDRQSWSRLKTNTAPKLMSFLLVLPFLLLVLLPVSMCSECWPGYVNGSLESIGQLDYRKLNGFVYPLLLITGNMTVVTVYLRSHFTKQPRLFLLVLVSMVAILSSKLVNAAPFMEVGGLLLYLIITTWLCFVSIQPERCPRCEALRIDRF